MVQRIIMDGDPRSAAEKIRAAFLDDELDVIVFGADPHSRESGQPAQADDLIGIANEVVDDDIGPVGQHVPVLPLGRQIGFIVGLEVANSVGNQAFDRIGFSSTDGAGIRSRTEETYDGHDVRSEEPLAKV